MSDLNRALTKDELYRSTVFHIVCGEDLMQQSLNRNEVPFSDVFKSVYVELASSKI